MADFLDKYYPGMSKKFAQRNIEILEKLVEDKKEEFKKRYKH